MVQSFCFSKYTSSAVTVWYTLAGPTGTPGGGGGGAGMPGGVGGGGTTPGESGGGGGGEAPACSHSRDCCAWLACAAGISASSEAKWAVARGYKTAQGHDHTSVGWLASVIAVLAQKIQAYLHECAQRLHCTVLIL